MHMQHPFTHTCTFYRPTGRPYCLVLPRTARPVRLYSVSITIGACHRITIRRIDNPQCPDRVCFIAIFVLASEGNWSTADCPPSAQRFQYASMQNKNKNPFFLCVHQLMTSRSKCSTRIGAHWRIQLGGKHLDDGQSICAIISKNCGCEPQPQVLARDG